MEHKLTLANFLKEKLMSSNEFDPEWTVWDYSEDINPDALTDEWLESRTSWVYRVGVLCAIDRNKCDWVHIAIGTQRREDEDFEIKGTFYFSEGENDDMGRVIGRAFSLLKSSHPAFEE